MSRTRNSLLHILLMDDFNNSLNQPAGARSISNTSRSTFDPQISQSLRLDRLRHSLRARANVAARRRRLGLGLGLVQNREELRSENPPVAASPGKRRKIEQHQAQIEMAQLELELAFCDGGKHKATNTRPESVLYENSDVYCTSGSHCNMIFQHVGAKCFTLKKMVIQGPSINYTSPVQEGIIFVTMDKEDLISGCKYPFRFENRDDDDENDEDDDEEDDPDLDESEDEEMHELNDLGFPLLEPCEHSQNAPRGSLSNFFQLDSSEQGSHTEYKPIEPSAKFKIRKDDRGNKMRATLTFEPALSGRYILARFFSPNRHDNIDIQFIGAYGYVGRRFFPAITPR